MDPNITLLRGCSVPFPLLFQSNYSLVRKACNIWRNFWDISDNWNSIQGYITFYGKNNELFQKYTGPGGFFDPDMVNIYYTCCMIDWDEQNIWA